MIELYWIESSLGDDSLDQPIRVIHTNDTIYASYNIIYTYYILYNVESMLNCIFRHSD
jgi:hypothetical protein